MLPQIGVGASGSNTHLGGSDLDISQLAEASDADQIACLQFARSVKHHHVGSTGDRQPCSWLAGIQAESFLQRAGCDEFVFGGIGPQSATSFREACATASKICKYP